MKLIKDIFTVKYTILGSLILIVYTALIPYLVEQNIPKADQFLGLLVVFLLFIWGFAQDIINGLTN